MTGRRERARALAARRGRRASPRPRRQLPRGRARRRAAGARAPRSGSATPSRDDRAPGRARRRGRSCAWRAASDRSAAEALRGQELLVARDRGARARGGRVVGDGPGGLRGARRGREVGVVARLLALPSCEVLEVARSDDAPPTLLVPLVRDAVRDVDLERRVDRRRPAVPRARRDADRRLHAVPGGLRLVRSQRHVANALALGHELHLRQLPRPHAAERTARSTTPRSAAGPGWCCASTSSRRRCVPATAIDPVELRDRRRVIALDPGGRLLDDALVDELAARAGADPAVAAATRALTSASSSTSPPTGCRSGATCWPGASWRRWWSATRCCASCPARWATSDSALEESFSAALEGGPEYPHYTRPAEYRGWRVPEVLLSGHHARIAEWRLAQSRARRAAAAGPERRGPSPERPLRA